MLSTNMKKTYQVDITDEKFLEAKKAIISNGGNIWADISFEIRGVKGWFKKEGTKLTIEITDKPWLASWEMIEEKLNQFFN